MRHMLQDVFFRLEVSWEVKNLRMRQMRSSMTLSRVDRLFPEPYATRKRRFSNIRWKINEGFSQKEKFTVT